MSFEKLGLCKEILAALEEQAYNTPTPIQNMAIPKIMGQKDLIASAQTGTGKTAAFVLPLLERLKDAGKVAHNLPRGLILAPTRELALQVFENVEKYSQNLDLRSAVLYGGVAYNPQLAKINDGLDIVVATPGRLMDLVENRQLKLGAVKYMVLDEADRMLDMGFAPAVRRVMTLLPKNRQTLMFSATFSKEVTSLASELLKNPVTIQSETTNTASKTVTHFAHPVDEDKKRALCAYLIGSNNWKQVLIFTRTKVAADRLSKELILDGIKNMVIHGDRTQGQRSKALTQFKEGKIQALVATDIASRGIDIDSLPHVINYELPNVTEDYIHRVGRTGRAGLSGQAITLVTEAEHYRLEAVERLIKRKIKLKAIAGFEPTHFDPEKIRQDILAERRTKAKSTRFKSSSKKAPADRNSMRGARGDSPSPRGRSAKQSAGSRKKTQKPGSSKKSGSRTSPGRKSQGKGPRKGK